MSFLLIIPPQIVTHQEVCNSRVRWINRKVMDCGVHLWPILQLGYFISQTSTPKREDCIPPLTIFLVYGQMDPPKGTGPLIWKNSIVNCQWWKAARNTNVVTNITYLVRKQQLSITQIKNSELEKRQHWIPLIIFKYEQNTILVHNILKFSQLYSI